MYFSTGRKSHLLKLALILILFGYTETGIFVQTHGDPSFLGKVWYAEADTPIGPWIYACKIVTHNKNSFYNPKHHVLFDQDGGRTIYFEGTYSHTFLGFARTRYTSV